MKRVWFLLLTVGMALIGITAVRQSATAVAIFVDSGQSLGLENSYDLSRGDVNGDGSPDFLAANGSTSRLWLNDGGGQFSSGAGFAVSSTNGGALADLNGDGALDVVLATGLEAVHIWTNEGGGQFSDSGRPLGDSEIEYLDVAVGDLDGDGDNDLFLATNQANQVWLNGEAGEPTGVFSDTGQALGWAYSNEVKLADIDADTDLDAIVANGSNNLRPGKIWLNDGAGFFSDSGQELGNNWDMDVAAADVDNDDDLDLLLTAYVGEDSLWINQGGAQGGTIGTFAQSGQIFHAGGGSSVALADVDDDGDADVVFGRVSQSPNTVWLNQGGAQGGGLGQFVDNQEALDTDVLNYDTILADWNGDGSQDILFGNFGGNTLFWNTVAPTPGVDLALTVCCSGDSFVEASLLFGAFTFTLQNEGSETATNVVLDLVDHPDAETLSSSEMTCALTPDRVCTLSALQPGESVQVRSTFIKAAETFNYALVGRLGDSASVTAAEPESEYWNNTARAGRRYYNCSQAGCAIEDIFCMLNASRSGWESFSRGATALRGMADNAFIPDLPLYYQVRDKVLLTTADGRYYFDLYETHNEEIFTLMTGSTALWDSGLATLAAWESHLQALMEGEGETAVVTTDQINVIDLFLTDLSAAGSPELQQAIADARAKIGDTDQYVGKPMTSVTGMVVGYAVHLPVVID